jgi:Type I phosphodiesterase / nucleotide pyrophosphatase
VDHKGAWFRAGCDLPVPVLRRLRRGYDPDRSPDVIPVPRGRNFFGGFTTTTHSGPRAYLQRIPLVFYGPGFIEPQGEVALDREVTVADLAPTLAELLHTPFPEGYPGRPIEEALMPREQRPVPPKLILTVVWDGGGWDVLKQWPDAWPHLKELMGGGTSVTGATVGSSPSVTPAIHATIGTGAWPDRHGIIDIPLRVNGRMVGSYEGRGPQYLKIPTLADLYDQATGNRAKVAMIAENNWHLGMIGHGAYLEGGDKDIAAMVDGATGDLITTPEYYSLPSYLGDVPGLEDDVRTVDMQDGKVDGLWMGHDLLGTAEDQRHTPAWIIYQTRLLEALIRREGFGRDAVGDLIFTNYKQLDLLGHDWNMVNPEVEDALRYSDAQLPALVNLLNRAVGKDQWVVAFTADHGQQPDALAVGAIPIGNAPLEADIAERFGIDASKLFQDERPTGFWLDHDTLDQAQLTPEDIADFMLDYRLKDNMTAAFPAQYDDRVDEKLFSAVLPSARLDDVWQCATGKS